MLIQKLGFLQRSRVVFTALVLLTGLGSTLVAMKPEEEMAAYTYGVAETSSGNHYQVIRNITGEPAENYDCNSNTTACTVTSDETPSPEGLIPKVGATVLQQGDFIYPD
jgi:hypothetical protein